MPLTERPFSFRALAKRPKAGAMALDLKEKAYPPLTQRPFSFLNHVN